MVDLIVGRLRNVARSSILTMSIVVGSRTAGESRERYLMVNGS